jgi:uncharacterized protein YuzE
MPSLIGVSTPDSAMRFSYDAETDSLYVHFAETPGTDAEEIAPNLVVDHAADGRVVGLDIQHASEMVDLTTLEVGDLPLERVLLGGRTAA